MVETMQKKLMLWLDGSLFFSGIIGFFNMLINFFEGSLPVRLFTADYDKEKLNYSRFVRLANGALNIFPKFLRFYPDTTVKMAAPAWLHGSSLIKSCTDSMETPMPTTSRFTDWIWWFGGAFAAWGTLAVIVATPFLPTMMLTGMVAVVFVVSLFRYDFKLDLLSVPLLLFMIITLFSGITSLARGTSMLIAVLTTIIMASCLLARVCFTSQKSVDFVLAAFITSAAVTGLVALYQIAIGYVNTTWVDQNLFAALSLRVYSTFGNPNVYGAYLLLAIPVAAAMVFYAQKPLYKLYALGVTGLLLLSLLLTYSRGCYLALMVAGLVFVLLLEKRMIVLFFAGLAAMPFVLPASVIARFASILNFSDSSTSFRLNIWQASIRVLTDFWMAGLGQGIEAYNQVYPFYAFSAVPSPHAHNLFLQVFLETGIIGLLAFMGILACFFRTQFSFMRNTKDKRGRILSIAMTSAVVGFLFQGIFDHVFYNYRVMLTFFLFMGFAGGVVGSRDDGSKA